MEKLEPVKKQDSFSKVFKFDGFKWTLSTEWGDAVIYKAESPYFYLLDRATSSLFNLTLVSMALNEESPEIKYTFEYVKERKCILQVQTPSELFTYHFFVSPYEILKKMRKDMVTLNEYLDRIQLPFSGSVIPKLLKEYGPRDVFVLFDFSFLNLKFPPLIFLFIIGREGYASLTERTPTDCKVYIHWNKVDPLDPENNTWRLGYVIVPQEVDKPPYPYEPFTFPKVRTGVQEGRGLIIYEDKVIDNKYLLERHIGGSATITMGQGREIGRYIYGSFQHAGATHTHTNKADTLIEKYQVGIMIDPLRHDMFEGIPTEKTISDYVCVLKSMEGITDVLMSLRLKTPGVQVIPILGRSKDFGKYFAMTSLVKKVTRNFACCFVIDKKIAEAHIKLAKAIEQGAEVKPFFEDMSKVRCKAVTIVAKNMGPFSDWLTSSDAKGTNFNLRGPFVII